MKNIKLTIQYDGSSFSGWQRQEGARSVQEEIEKVISKIFKEKISIDGSGRTDRGVHAYGQVANFKVDTNIPAEKLIYKLPKELPVDIRIIKTEEVEEDFHARFSAISKTYKFKIYNGKDLHPIYRKYYSEIDAKLDYDKMIQAGQKLLGRHDFRNFGFKVEEEKPTEIDLNYFDLKYKENEIEMTFKSKAFLRKQVRIMAGTLIYVGMGKLKVEDIDRIFKKEISPGRTLSPSGLYLMEVEY